MFTNKIILFTHYAPNHLPEKFYKTKCLTITAHLYLKHTHGILRRFRQIKQKAADRTSAQQGSKQAGSLEALTIDRSHALTRQTMEYADAKAQELLQNIEAKILDLPKPRPIEVKTATGTRRLESPAHPLLQDLLTILQIPSKHPYLVGPAGCGKTTMAAQALGLDYGHISLTAGASETWLWGRQTPKGFQVGQFAHMYEHGGVFLFDEFDAADANLLIALNTALANGSAYNPIEGRLLKKHENFYAVAAGNTFGMGADFAYTGRERLDKATLDRFAPLLVDYLPELEQQICPDEEIRDLLVSARGKLRDMQSEYANNLTYRGLAFAYEAYQAGMSAKKVVNILTAGWPEGLAKKAGLL